MSYSPCFDACNAINPQSPLRVADSLREIFDLLQKMSDFRHIKAIDFNEKYPEHANEPSALIVEKLAIEAKNLLEKATDNLPF